jgi:hypothetical protein
MAQNRAYLHLEQTVLQRPKRHLGHIALLEPRPVQMSAFIVNFLPAAADSGHLSALGRRVLFGNRSLGGKGNAVGRILGFGALHTPR